MRRDTDTPAASLPSSIAGEINGSGSSVKFRGVRKRPRGRFAAEIRDPWKKARVCLGTFDSADDATARNLRGAKAKTNFPLHQQNQHPYDNPMEDHRSISQRPTYTGTSTTLKSDRPPPAVPCRRPPPATVDDCHSDCDSSPPFDSYAYVAWLYRIWMDFNYNIYEIIEDLSEQENAYLDLTRLEEQLQRKSSMKIDTSSKLPPEQFEGFVRFVGDLKFLIEEDEAHLTELAAIRNATKKAKAAEASGSKVKEKDKAINQQIEKYRATHKDRGVHIKNMQLEKNIKYERKRRVTLFKSYCVVRTVDRTGFTLEKVAFDNTYLAEIMREIETSRKAEEEMRVELAKLNSIKNLISSDSD